MQRPRPTPSVPSSARSRSTRTARSRTSAWTSSTLAGPKGRVEPGVPNPDSQSCAATSVAAAIRETLPEYTTAMAARFVTDARQMFPEIRNPFLLMEALALPNFVIQVRKWMGCGCPVAAAEQIGVTYVRPPTTETSRPIHIQSLCSSLAFPHPTKCDTCHALTVSGQCFEGAPEYLVLDSPGHYSTPEGATAEDPSCPGIYHETRRPVYFNGAPYRTTAIICMEPATS